MNRQSYIRNLKSLRNIISNQILLLESDVKGTDVLERQKNDLKHIDSLSKEKLESNAEEITQYINKSNFSKLLDKPLRIDNEKDKQDVLKAVKALSRTVSKIEEKRNNIKAHLESDVEGIVRTISTGAKITSYIIMLLGIALIISGLLIVYYFGINRELRYLMNNLKEMLNFESAWHFLKNLLAAVWHLWMFKICCLPLTAGITLFVFGLKFRTALFISDNIFDAMVEYFKEIMKSLTFSKE